MTTGIPSGVGGSLGFKTESVYGTAVTVDSFVPMVSEGVDNKVDYLTSDAIRANRLTPHTNDVMTGKKWLEGSFDFELANMTVQHLLTHVFGGVTTTGTNPYTHTFVPVDLLGKSFTLQVGRPSSDGTINPFTWAGCKATKLTIGAKAGELVTASLDVIGQTETTATALASPSYASIYNPFTFVEASLTIAGSTVAVCKELSLEIGNSLSTDRFFLGSALLSEPLRNGMMDISGKATIEFSSTGLTHYARYTGGTTAALVATFSDGTSSLVITTLAYFVGSGPNVKGPDLLEMELDFAVLGTTDALAITAVMVNADSTAA